MCAKVYNIAYSAPFAQTLADKFTREYQNHPLGLSDVLFLVPSRRAATTLKEAFLQSKGLEPFLLPQIVPVGDLDEDEVFFSNAAGAVLSNLPAAISSEERLFLFAKLIFSSHKKYGLAPVSFAQSLSLAADLAKLIDSADNQLLSFENLKNIVPSQYATHWQETLKFLEIITQYWPEILKERGAIDACMRKQILLGFQAESWQKNPPKTKIVAAGLSVAFDGLKKILEAVFSLQNGEIYLYGLDRYLSDEEFEKVDLTHPQFEKKNILNLLKLKREDVQDLLSPPFEERERLVFEIMRPAETSLEWQNLKNSPFVKKALHGFHIVETKDNFEEAQTIALIMRETLETPSKTAALVTTDRALARAVSSALKRFDISIDDSSGIPLHLCPIGIYLRQMIEVLKNDFSEVSIAALLKNAFVRLGFDDGVLLSKVRAAELEKRLPRFQTDVAVDEEESPIVALLKQKFEKMTALFKQEKVPFKTLMTEHILLAEELATNNNMTGADRLWRFEDGKMCAAFLSRLIEYADIISDINPAEYGAALDVLLATQTVRKSYGSHPRLKILGPIEARFNRYDVMIIGSLNEGVFPSLPSSDPFMSRNMKKDFGLDLPERAIGVLSDDLSSFMCAGEVFLTRAERVCGTPMSKSRYLLRLSTVLKGYGLEMADIENVFYKETAKKLEEPERFVELPYACPKPPLASRPRKFSATAIEKLMIDPYEVYARYILKLKPLNDLDDVLDQTHYGTLVHKILERFNQIYPHQLDENALQTLLDIGQKEFERCNLEADQKAFWLARFEKTARWIVAKEQIYRAEVAQTHHEIWGSMSLEAPRGPVVIEARADRIDEMKDGTFGIIDYKTGRFPSAKQILSGYAPQLPVEALIAQSGGFESKQQKLPAKKVSAVSYWGLAEKIVSVDKDLPSVLLETQEHIQALLASFDDENTPYLPRPNSKHANPHPDYEHLSRLKEYVVGDDEDE
ncbi:MAG: PD-(D/E)XK nuclease family protein [Alphaproteobacteria bacterium]|nr:PD-(D/E)XK nuclease family protein [Alphaproteobacteria bacterium]